MWERTDVRSFGVCLQQEGLQKSREPTREN